MLLIQSVISANFYNYSCTKHTTFPPTFHKMDPDNWFNFFSNIIQNKSKGENFRNKSLQLI